MVEVLQLTHFSKDRRRPKKLVLVEDPPQVNERRFAEEGRFMVIIDEGDEGRKVFGLSEAEAALLYVRLGAVLHSHSGEYMNAVSQAAYERRAEGRKGDA